jgi:hypothetical protein
MKTKEIDVWIPECRVNVKGLIETYSDLDELRTDWDGVAVKAKLIIEIPEKKIEITESEFDEKWRNHEFCEGDTKKDFKKELGF